MTGYGYDNPLYNSSFLKVIEKEFRCTQDTQFSLDFSCTSFRVEGRAKGSLMMCWQIWLITIFLNWVSESVTWELLTDTQKFFLNHGFLSDYWHNHLLGSSEEHLRISSVKGSQQCPSLKCCEGWSPFSSILSKLFIIQPHESLHSKVVTSILRIFCQFYCSIIDI